MAEKVPQDAESEQVILGNCFLRESIAPLGDLTEECFFSQKHRKIFSALVAVAAQHAPIDLVQVSQCLAQRGNGISATEVANLTDGIPLFSKDETLLWYRDRLKTLLEQRRALSKAFEIGEAAKRGEPVVEIIERAKRLVEKAETKRVPEKELDAALAPPRKCPEVPEECWTGFYKEYRDRVTRNSEAPDNFHFAGFSVAVAAGLGKSVFVQNPDTIYGNLFVCLVGESNAHKGSAQAFSTRLLKSSAPGVAFMTSLDSAQGLISTMKLRASKAPALVIKFTEMRTLIEKVNQKWSGDLVPKLCDLYDCVDRIEINTKNSFTEMDNPPPGVFYAGTTPEWMEDLQPRDLQGGLGARVLFFPGDPKAPISRAIPPDLGGIDVHLKEVFEYWHAKGTTELTLSNAAWELWDTWYGQRPTLRCTNRLVKSLSNRHHSYVLKFASHAAALDYSSTIEPIHLKPAIALVTGYLYPSLFYLFSDFSLSPFGRLEQKMVELVKAHNREGGLQVKRVLGHFQHGAWDRWAIRRALENVAGKHPDDPTWDGDLKIVSVGRKRFVRVNEDV